MASPADFRKLALSLPETLEKSHFGNPDFRVRNKIFAGLSGSPQRGSFKATPARQNELLTSDPEAFEPAAGAWGRSGWTYVALERVSVASLREIVTESWRLIAPASLRAAAQPGAAANNASPGTKKRTTKRR